MRARVSLRARTRSVLGRHDAATTCLRASWVAFPRFGSSATDASSRSIHPSDVTSAEDASRPGPSPTMVEARPTPWYLLSPTTPPLVIGSSTFSSQ